MKILKFAVAKEDATVFLIWLAVNIFIFAYKCYQIKPFCGVDLEAFAFLGTSDYACQTTLSCCKDGTDPNGNPCNSPCQDPCNLFARAIGHNLMFNMALVILPALRNSFFVKLPYIGQPFERTIRAHRWFGFAVFVFMVLHMLGWWSAYGPVSPGWICWSWTFGLRSDQFLGHVAMLFHGVQALFALEYFRRNYFETFYFTHLLYIPLYVFAIWHSFGVQDYTLSTMWDGEGQYFMLYLIGPLLLYFIDRCVRFFLSHCVPTALVKCEVFPPADHTGRSAATSVKLTIRRKMYFEPGQYCFLLIPRCSMVQWHPFTICSSPQLNRHPNDESTVSFHIKSMGPGTWTGDLHELATKTTLDGSDYFPVALDGPYGKPSVPLDKHPVMVFISGGVGVTPMMSMMLSLLHEPNRYPALRQVFFHWSFKETDQVDWFAPVWLELFPRNRGPSAGVTSPVPLKSGAPGAKVHVNGVDFTFLFHVSDLATARAKEHLHRQSNHALGQPTRDGLFTELPPALFSPGRPNVRQLLSAIADDVANANPSSTVQVGVFTCGPGPLMDNVEKESAVQSSAQISFCVHRETFGF